MAETNALPLVLLTEQFAKLPGIGMKSAQRLAYHVMRMSDKDAEAFANAVLNVHKNVHLSRNVRTIPTDTFAPSAMMTGATTA